MGIQHAPPKVAQSRQFSAHVYCGQTAGWIKMPLSTELGLGSGDIMLDGDPSPRKRGHSPPTEFSAIVYCGQTAGWIKMPLGTEVDLGPGHIVFDRDPDATPPPKGDSSLAPLFGPHLLWPNGRPSHLLLSSCFSKSIRPKYFIN